MEDTEQAIAKPITERRFGVWVQVATVVILLITVGVSAWSSSNQSNLLRKQIADQNEFAANASWENFVEVAIEYPEMASGYDELPSDRKTLSSYHWFVERLLFAGEQVLYATNDDAQWHLGVKREALRHSKFLQSSAYNKDDFCSYRKPVREILIAVEQEREPLSKKFRSMTCPSSYD